ncbi:MAG: signal peptidase I [Actinomycetes bacterium]
MGHKKARNKKRPSLGRELVTVVGTALILSILVRTFLIQAFYVPSASMKDTLQENDRIIVSKISTRITGIDRSNVIVFHDPGGWLGEGFPNPYDNPVGRVLQAIGIVPSNSGNDLVKRVIGVANDKVECCDLEGRVTVNGIANDASFTKDGVTSDQVTFSVLVPEGNVFVLGDNRGNSEDSRFHLDKNNGMVPVEEIIGRVSMRIWPIGRIGGIEN